jgi:hypothetical protein
MEKGSKPAVKIQGTDGKITKILFSDIRDVVDHRRDNDRKPELETE